MTRAAPSSSADESPPTNTSEPSGVSAERVITELARHLHASGAPAYELDQRMEDVAAFLNRPATFFSTPTSLFITFDHEEGRTRLLRVYPCDTNLGRYAGLYATQRAIELEGLSVAQAWERIQTLESTTNAYSQPLQLLAYGAAAACFGVLVGGTLTVVASAGMIGLLTGGLLIGLSQHKYPAHLINIIAAFAACIIASLVQTRFPSGSVELTTLASLIVLVPGLQLTISINELATQNLASGSARFAGAMTSLLTLVFGVYMGHALIHSLMAIPASTAAQAPATMISMASILPLGIVAGRSVSGALPRHRMGPDVRPHGIRFAPPGGCVAATVRGRVGSRSHHGRLQSPEFSLAAHSPRDHAHAGTDLACPWQLGVLRTVGNPHAQRRSRRTADRVNNDADDRVDRGRAADH